MIFYVLAALSFLLNVCTLMCCIKILFRLQASVPDQIVPQKGQAVGIKKSETDSREKWSKLQTAFNPYSSGILNERSRIS